MNRRSLLGPVGSAAVVSRVSATTAAPLKPLAPLTLDLSRPEEEQRGRL